MNVSKTLVALLAWSLAQVGFAQLTVDGSRDAGYGPPVAVQVTQTGFGNNTFGDVKQSRSGSELNAIYAKVVNDGGVDKLFVMLTGNLETGNVPSLGGSFNKLEIVIDSIAEGQNIVDNSDPLPILEKEGTPGLPDGQGVFATVEGTQFDAGFTADYWLVFVNGFETPSGGGTAEWAFTSHYGQLKPVSQGGVAFNLGGSTDAAGTGQNANGTLEDAANNNGDPFDQFWIDRGADNSFVNLQAAINNSNVGGVPSGSTLATPDDQAAAAAATTGIEFAIPLASIGNPSGPIKIMAWINGGTHDFASNQFLAGLGDFGNLANGSGTPPNVVLDLAAIDGDQFITVPVTGDMDCDGDVDFDDIDDFVLGLNNPALYLSNFGVPAALKGDTDVDGDLDFDDIAGFVERLSGAGASAVPEPSSLLLLLSAVAVTFWSFRSVR